MTKSRNEQSSGLCPVKFLNLYQDQKDGINHPDMYGDAECPSTCSGTWAEPRKIGGVILPRIFDKIYCGEMEEFPSSDIPV